MSFPVRTLQFARGSVVCSCWVNPSPNTLGRTKAKQSLNVSYILIEEKRWNPKRCQQGQIQSWTQVHWAGISGVINRQPSICTDAGDWVSQRGKKSFKTSVVFFLFQINGTLAYWCWPEFAVFLSIRGLRLGHHKCSVFRPDVAHNIISATPCLS